jgi:KUP system potassium uptake protein
MQAVQLQYIPRVKIDHTSQKEFGQIYVKSVNILLMLACIALVLIFKTSSNLAAAYGIAVTTTMVITTLLFYFYASHSWGWHPLVAMGVCGFFLSIELSFWGANLLKVFHGGWFPLVVGFFIYIIMTTWHRGREILSERMQEIIVPLNQFLENVRNEKPHRVPGVAVYMSGHPQFAPATVIQSYRHFQCLHEHLIFLSVKTTDIPHVPHSNRITLQSLGPQVYRLVMNYGFMDLPNVTEELKGIELDHRKFLEPKSATFFLGREHIMATERRGMAIWREKLFALMSRNAQPATAFFHLPKNRVIEIGSLIEL